MTIIELEEPAVGADKYRKQVGRQRWYTIDGWEGPSVSTVKKASGGDWSFVTSKRIAEAIHERPNLLEGLDDLNDIKTKLRAVDRDGLRAAADRGTAVHTYIENGRTAPSPAADAGYYDAVDDLFTTHDIDTLHAEFVTVNTTLNGVGYGGTCDAVVTLDGTPYLVDWKSRGADSKHGAYPEEAMQLGAYWGAERWIDPDTDSDIDKPEGMTTGLIVSIKPDGARLYPIDLAAAYDRFCDLHAWWISRRTEREPIGRVWPLKKSPPTPATVPDVTVETVGDVASTPEPPAGVDATTLDEQRARYKALPEGVKGHVVWPDDRTDPEAIKAALDAVDRRRYRDMTAEPEPPPTPTWPTPDDGPPADPEHVAGLASHAKGLTEPQRSAIRRITAEAKTAGHLWGRSDDGTMTVRRHDLIWSIIHLLENDFDDDGFFRALAVLATGDETCRDLRAPIGAVIAHLTVDDAAAFMWHTIALVKGELSTVVRDDGQIVLSTTT